MRLIVGILLFVLCIITVPTLKATELGNELQPESTAPVETLEKEYVELDLTATETPSISIMQAVKSLTTLIQSRYLSLLNWSLHNRSVLEIPNYNRPTQFGRWINDPNDQLCFNTRAKVLVRDSIRSVAFRDNNHCVVDAGVWNDPYTTSTIKSSREIQIDHLVPLKNAYLSGAHRWSFRARCLYSNYLGNDFHLLSVDGVQNMKKGERSPEKYMPPNSEYTCTYVRNWLAVKMIWGLTMDREEADTIHSIIVEHHCNLSQFRMTEAQLNSQREFTKDNIDLCEKLDRARGQIAN